MSEKELKYKEIIPQIQAVIAGETDLVANTANVIAILKQTFNWFWVGVYFVKDKELVLGPFQGPIACTRIAFNKGVCGVSWAKKETILVDNVHEFPGHISCNPASKSEIVIPVFDEKKEVSFILDIDSDKLNRFDKTDSIYLNQIVKLLEK